MAVLQPPPKPTPTEREALARYEKRKKRNEAALTILHALLLRSVEANQEAERKLLIKQAYGLATEFVEQGEA